jgi:predicted DNA-binding protein
MGVSLTNEVDDQQSGATSWRIRSLWLEPTADQKLRRLAGATGRSSASLIREAIGEFISRHEQGKGRRRE